MLRVSYMEIYNEQTIDLLTANPQPVRIFESKDGEVSVRGLTEEVVSSPAQVFSLLCEGETRRQVGSTNMNKHSSRSHTIFRIWIESRSSEYEHSNVRISSLSLVDLAGSESIRLSGSTGERRKEGQYINKSLMALGQVVYKLSELNRQSESPHKVHIPYRDSKLTRLLQPSLSGNAQIVVICNISPQASHLEESHNTLKFAIRAKRIQQKAIRTEVVDEKTLLQSYRQEIQDLKDQLRQAQEAQKQLESQNAFIGDDDTRELVEAIQKMERLILKTKTPPHPIQSTENLASAASSELTDMLSSGRISSDSSTRTRAGRRSCGRAASYPGLAQYRLGETQHLLDSSGRSYRRHRSVTRKSKTSEPSFIKRISPRPFERQTVAFYRVSWLKKMYCWQK